MKYIFFILSIYCAPTLFGQKTTIVVNQDSLVLHGELNGLYVSDVYENQFEVKKESINVNERLYLEFNHNFIRIVQLNVTPERALELYEKDRLFNPKLTILFAELKEKDSVKNIVYQNLDSSFLESDFIEFSYKEDKQYNVRINDTINNNRKPTIQVPVYISKDVPRITKRNMILLGKSDYYHTVEQLLFTKLE